jgi:hypothetical protein
VASPRALRLALDVGLACLLFWGAHAVYRGSTGHVQNCDSVYSLVVAEKLLADGTVNLTGCVPADETVRRTMAGYTPGHDLPYQLIRHPIKPRPGEPQAVYYGYPLGSTVLSLPFVEFSGVRRGLSMLHPDGRPNTPMEDVLQLRIAARVSAAVGVLSYVLCRFFCPPLVSLLIAAGFAFGSPVWSTLARSLWSHTWMVAWLSAAVVLLVARKRVGHSIPESHPSSPPPLWGRSARGAGRVGGGCPSSDAVSSPPPADLRSATSPTGGGGEKRTNGYGSPRSGMTWRTDVFFGLTLGTALFWVLFVRAHGVFSAAAIGVYLLLHHRRTLLVTVAAGGVWSAALVAVSLIAFGTLTPPSVYSPDTIDGRDVLNRLFWLMASPSRGLLVYCPYVAAVGLILVAFRKRLTDAGLLLPVGLAVAGHTALLACYNGWHGGSSYGPRYFCDVLPWFVLATAIAVRGLMNTPSLTVGVRPRLLAALLLAACFGWGVFVHSRGANSVRAWLWNARSLAVGQEAAVQEWTHPQFLAGLTFEVNPDGSVKKR